MTWIAGIYQFFLDWSVERKMAILLFGSIVVVPLVALVILHSKGAYSGMNFLVGLITAGVILFVPLAKWMSHTIALRNIKELNNQCTLIKQGNYSHVALPLNEVEGEGHDFILLKRNMYWMGHAIASRENRIQASMAELAASQRQIGESLDYARLIQTSFLPDKAHLKQFLPEHFLLWNQRDTVGGDSYWFCPWENGFFVGVIDCTGHGVPGAFMTLIVHSLLSRAVKESAGSPAAVLGNMNQRIKRALRQDKKGATSDDGMDCALCHVDLEKGQLTFAGANSPLFCVGESGCQVIKADRCGLGYVRSPLDYRFTDVVVPIQGRMRFYLATDGLMDQVGGDKRLPFGKRRFVQFVEKNFQTPIAVQGAELSEILKQYQGSECRRDDVTVLGFECGERGDHGK